MYNHEIAEAIRQKLTEIGMIDISVEIHHLTQELVITGKHLEIKQPTDYEYPSFDKIDKPVEIPPSNIHLDTPEQVVDLEYESQKLYQRLLDRTFRQN